MTDIRSTDTTTTTTTLVRQVLADSLAFLWPAALRAIVQIGIPDLLADNPQTPAQLAERTGADAGHLWRLLRFLAMRKIVREDDAGAFHLLAPAQLLRQDSPVPLRSIVLQFTDETYWQPAGRLEETVRTGHTVFEDIFGASFFDLIDGDDERSELFGSAIADLSALEHGPIAASYDFPSAGTVVDVAGGRGGLLHAVLAANPGLRGILIDRERQLSRHRLDDPAIAGRWQTAAADISVAVPGGADIYLLKRILHDKTDDECRAVLNTVRKAMPSGAKLLVIDPIVPPGNAPQHPNTASDVLMMTVWNGRERTEAELRDLLASADLRLDRVLTTPTTLSIAEASAI